MLQSQSIRIAAYSVAACAFIIAASMSAQQPSQPDSGAASTDQAAGRAVTSDEAAKAKIMASPAWRQANEGFQKWLESQTIYTPEDIARIKAKQLSQIRAMPASELQGFLDDWQARLKVLNGQDFQEAQQWLGEMMSVMVDGFRRQTLKDLGLTDVANMSAAQLEDAIIRVRADRLSRQANRAAFELQRQQMSQTIQQMNAAAQIAQQQRNNTAARFATHQSPYRPPRFDPPPPRRQQFFVDGNGRIGFLLPY